MEAGRLLMVLKLNNVGNIYKNGMWVLKMEIRT